MLIISWYEDKESDKSIADVAVGGKDDESLQNLINDVKDAAEDVTF